MDTLQPTVLIVDDYRCMRRIVSRLLREIGIQRVVEAEDGRDAADKLAGGGVDCVISDWDMPHMDGLELLAHVRRDAALRHTPFLMLTAESGRSNLLRAVRAGVDGYLLKPFTVDSLHLALAHALSQAARRAAQAPDEQAPVQE